MISPLHVFAWWPRVQEDDAVAEVRRVAVAPGVVTLTWQTGLDLPTVVAGIDGREIFRDDARRTRHALTLTGSPGSRTRLRILAGAVAHGVDVAF